MGSSAKGRLHLKAVRKGRRLMEQALTKWPDVFCKQRHVAICCHHLALYIQALEKWRFWGAQPWSGVPARDFRAWVWRRRLAEGATELHVHAGHPIQPLISECESKCMRPCKAQPGLAVYTHNTCGHLQRL